MKLPDKKTPPKRSLSDVSTLIYGPSKIGKSSLAAQAPGAIFLATEAGLNALDVYQQPISSWPEFLEACAALAKGDHEFKTIVIDTLDILATYCASDVCKRLEIEHEADAGYGKGYALVQSEMLRALTKLASLPYGLIIISHSREREIETRTGKITKTVPTVPEKIRQIIVGLVDLILYCDVETTKGPNGEPTQRRVMRTKPHINYDAGDRFGILPPVMPLEFKALRDALEAPSAKRQPDDPKPTGNPKKA